VGLPIPSIVEGGSYIALIGGATMALLSRLPRQTIAEQAKLIEALNGRIASLETSVKENRDALLEAVHNMGLLQGQVEVYKGLPLISMAESMKGIADSNSEILSILKSSAVTLAQTEAAKADATRDVAGALQ